MKNYDLNYTKNLFKKAKEARARHEEEMSEAYSFTYPHRDIWRSMESNTDRTKLYDMTAVHATSGLVSTILNLLIPQNQQWAYLDAREEVKKTIAPDVRQILDTTNKTIFKTLRSGNFYVAISEALQDCVIAGTGAIALYDPMTENGEIDFMAIPTSQLYFLTNYKDEVETVFREHEQTQQFIYERYGYNMPELEAPAKREPEKKIKVLECVHRPVGETEMIYSVHIGKDMMCVEETFTPVNPFVIFRFGKTIQEVWGESPVRSALPHIRVANEVAKLILTQASWAGLGAWQVASDTTVNYSNLQLNPGDVVTVDSPLQPIPFAGNFNLTMATVEDQRESIRQMLFADTLLPPQQSPTMTATEVQARQAEFYRRIGPHGLRLEQELLRPLIKTLVTKLQIRGLVPEFVTDQGTFEYVVNSAVRKGTAMQTITRDLQLLQMVSQLGPDAIAQVDVAKLARNILREGDMSPDVIRDLREVEQMKQQMAQQQQIQGMAQQLTNEQQPPEEPQS
tara:strand:- start:8884 stop:10413 length:1530 start_codon:yes stop_codon:yes gene_type:complete